MWENALTLLNLFVVILVLVLQILVLCTPRRTGICGHLRVAMEEKVSLTLTPDEDLSACLFAFFKAKCDSKQFQDISAKEDIKQQLPAIDFPDKSDNKCNVCAKERVCSCSFPLSACEQNSTEDTSNNDNCLVDETDTTAIDIGSVESETDQGEDENIDSQCSSFDTNEAKLQRNIKRHDEVEICHGPSEFDFAEAKHEQSNNHDQVDGKSQRNNKVNIPGERSVSLHLDVHANIDRYDTVLLNEKVDNNSQNNNEMTIPISWNDIPDADFEVNNVSSVSLHEASKIPAIRESCGNELGHRNNVAFGQNSPLDSSAQDCSVEENVMYKNCHNGKEDYCRPAVAINTTCNYAYDTCEFTASVNSCIERNQNSYNGTDDNAFVSTDCTIENTDVCFNNVNNNGDQYKAERYSNSMTKQDEHDFKCQGVQEPFSEKESIEPYEHIISNDTTCGSDINDMNRDLYVSESLCAQGLDNTCSSKCNVFDTRNSALDTDLIESIRKKCSSVEQDKNVVCNDLSHHGPDAAQPVPVSEYIPEQDHIDPQIESITEIETETKLQQCLDEELQCGSEFDPYDFVDEVDYLTSDVFYVKVHKPSLKKLQVKILGDAEENATKESKTADGKTSNTKTSNENAVKKMVMGVNRCVVEAPQEASGHFFPDCGSKDVKEQKETPSTSVFHNRTRQRTIACTGPSSQQQQNNSYTFAISCKTNMDFMLMDTPTLIIQMSFPKTSIARKNNVYAICRPKKQSNPISGQAHIWADSRFALAVDKVWVSCKAAFQKHPITVPWASCSGTIELKLSFQQPLNDRGIEHYLKRQLQNVNEGHMSLHEAKKSEEADTVIVFPSQETCDQSSLPIQIKPSIRGQRESPISLQKEQPLRDILKTDVELYTPEKDSEGSFLLHNFHHEKGITETDAFPDIRLNPGVQLLANDVDTMIKLEVSSAKHKQKGSIQIREDNHMCVHLRQEVDDGYNSFESETDGVTYTDCDIEVDTVPDIQVQLKETNSLQKLTPECFQCHRGPYSDGQFPVKCYTNQALKSDSSTCQTVDEVGYLASDVCYMEVHKPSLKNMQVKILGDAEQNATKESKTEDKENDSEDCTTIMEGNLCNTTASKKTAVNKVFIDVNRCDVEAPQEASRQWFPDSGSKDIKEPSETLLTSDITETDAIPDKPLNPGAQLLANDVDTIIKVGQQRPSCLNPTLPDRLCPKSRPEHLANTAEELHQVHETQLKSEVSSVKHSPGRKIKIGEDNSMFVNLRQDVVGGYSSLESETGGVIHTDCEIEVDTAPDVRDNANILQILRPEDLQCNRGNHSSDPYPNSCYNDQASESDSTTYERVLLTVTRCSNNFQSQQKINLVVVSDCVSLKDSTIQDGEQNTITLDRSSSDSAYNSMDSFSSDGNEQFLQ
ncbi:uncharacterized protein LOC128206647 isoform X2 [Mya arenaria]|uniref:uncharacterized protein LOC128206647 isoform X2 n=1 Tax=Mya arenaria TaxID=6604 RepID=UPI0022E02F53|nr:uncharacterized protein LOC128206647 isoform X2 [Mya arenaria]